MDVTAKILNEFIENTKLFEDFKAKLESILSELLKAESINPHQITCRVKDSDKLKRKIERKGDKYTCLNDITDIVGLRIIAYFEDDVDIIAEIVRKEFKIDEPSSVDKRKLETDRFGYQSLHYVVSLNSDRAKITENKKYSDLKAEIQIRSVLQHAWAEIEHDLGYKSEIEIPHAARRSFYRVAALLETADIEFTKIKEFLNKYTKDVADKIINEPNNILLDKTSLRTLIKHDPSLKEIDKAILRGRPIKEDDVSIELMVNYHLRRLDYLGIKTIKMLGNLLVTYRNEIIEYGEKYFSSNNVSNDKSPVIKGAALVSLAYYMVAKENDEKKVLDFLQVTFPQQRNNHITARKIIRVYKELNKLNS